MCVLISPEYLPACGWSSCMFNFLRSYQTVSPRGCSICIPTSHSWGFQVFLILASIGVVSLLKFSLSTECVWKSFLPHHLNLNTFFGNLTQYTHFGGIFKILYIVCFLVSCVLKPSFCQDLCYSLNVCRSSRRSASMCFSGRLFPLEVPSGIGSGCRAVSFFVCFERWLNITCAWCERYF